MKYVLKSRPYNAYPGTYWDGYYIGKKYRLLREDYAVADTNIENAKVYSSRKRAENACEKLNDKVCNYQFDVEEIDDETDI